ncbi:hypothetical protein EA187_05945 [Lujinxingia sediminis]|uniref:HTH HARE-type domain-containing protein n=1 Tax=Lujinxingia sediminis TaxID=2480984 RepID=A0ABY0CUC8_9DELT|nr:restriction endonuclease [Lujinxingia sediminis]RVU46677.1 hypothetical protein EA187_05945 [Lujinxingia sediminis]
MPNDQPTFDQYIAPLLSLLARHPDGLTTAEVYAALANDLNLSQAQIEELLPSGTQPIHQNRIGWAHDRLKRADLSESVKRGFWALTSEGRSLAKRYEHKLPQEVIHSLARPRNGALDLNTLLPFVDPSKDDEPSVKNEPPSESFTSIEAAKIVLADASGPLHFNEITRRILERDLWKTTGKTPAATISATLAVDIKYKGEDSDFRRTKAGYYELNRDGLENPSEVEIEVEDSPEVEPGLVSSPAADAPVKNTETLSFTDAAERILQVFAEREPMHHTDITSRALDLRLIETKSQNPSSTLLASVSQEIQRRKERSDTPRFELHGNGLIGLTRWSQTGLTAYIQAHNDRIRARLHQQLFEMDPTEFEELVGRLLIALGFGDVDVTSRSNDGGIDVRGTLVVGDVIRTRMAVQVKRWKNNISSPTVQQVRGSLGSHEQGLIITTSDFSSGARIEAERPDATPVGLMDGTQLVKLLVEYGIGVEKDELSLLRLG